MHEPAAWLDDVDQLPFGKFSNPVDPTRLGNRQHPDHAERELLAAALPAETVQMGFWLWLTVPSDAAPGTYTGSFTFRTSGGSATPVLSTLCLMGLFAVTGKAHAGAARYAVLLAASVLIGVAVVIGREPAKPEGGAAD